MLKKTAALLFLFAGLSTTAMADDSKLILDVAFERNMPVGAGITHTQSMQNEVRVEFDKKAAMSLENGWVLQILATDRDPDADLALTVLDSDKPDAKIMATPRLLTPYGKNATVKWSKDGENLSISLKPIKQNRH